jgi:hypothetical protein
VPLRDARDVQRVPRALEVGEARAHHRLAARRVAAAHQLGLVHHHARRDLVGLGDDEEAVEQRSCGSGGARRRTTTTTGRRWQTSTRSRRIRRRGCGAPSLDVRGAIS